MARGRISRFPIDLRRRPYNTVIPDKVCLKLRAFADSNFAIFVNNFLAASQDKLRYTRWAKQIVLKPRSFEHSSLCLHANLLAAFKVVVNKKLGNC